MHSRRPRTRQGAGPGLRQHQGPTEWACSQAGDPSKSLISLREHIHNDAVSERVLQCVRDGQAQNDTDASGRRCRLHNRLQLRPSGRLLHGPRGGRRVVHGIAAAVAALVAVRPDHAPKFAGAWMTPHGFSSGPASKALAAKWLGVSRWPSVSNTSTTPPCVFESEAKVT